MCLCWCIKLGIKQLDKLQISTVKWGANRLLHLIKWNGDPTSFIFPQWKFNLIVMNLFETKFLQLYKVEYFNPVVGLCKEGKTVPHLNRFEY